MVYDVLIKKFDIEANFYIQNFYKKTQIKEDFYMARISINPRIKLPYYTL